MFVSTCVLGAVINSYVFWFSSTITISRFSLQTFENGFFFQSAGGRVPCWVRKLSERSIDFLLVMKIYVSPIMVFLFHMHNWNCLNSVYFCLFSCFNARFYQRIGNFVAILLLASIDNRHFPVFAFCLYGLVKIVPFSTSDINFINFPLAYTFPVFFWLIFLLFHWFSYENDL